MTLNKIQVNKYFLQSYIITAKGLPVVVVQQPEYPKNVARQTWNQRRLMEPDRFSVPVQQPVDFSVKLTPSTCITIDVSEASTVCELQYHNWPNAMTSKRNRFLFPNRPNVPILFFKKTYTYDRRSVCTEKKLPWVS